MHVRQFMEGKKQTISVSTLDTPATMALHRRSVSPGIKSTSAAHK
jgi:hypothetical protein